MLNKIQNILVEKALKNQLHNLYILEGNHTDTDQELLKWSVQLLENLISKNGVKRSLVNHEDILVLSIKDKQKSYSSDEIAGIFQFLHYKSADLPRKFLVIPDASLLSEGNFNKLLKTFEEPPIPLTTLLINPNITKLLPTISSRGIKVRLPLGKLVEPELFLDPKWSFTQFSDFLTGEKLSIKNATSLLLNQLINSDIDLASVTRIQTQLINLEQDMLFHSSNQAKTFKLYNCLSELSS
jgi:hypothetical protein